MRKYAALLVPAALIVGVSCSSSSSTTPKPAAAPAPTAAAPAAARGAAPAGAPAAQAAQAGGRGAGAAAGAQGGGRGGPPQTPEMRAARRDSISALRASTVKEQTAKIAGHETEPAEKVFKNLQLMKNVPAGQLLAAMDQMGRALSINCDGCHLMSDFASDSLARKGRARIMLNMVNTINTDPNLLQKLGPGRGGAPRAVNCMTCHRGGNAGSNALIP